MFEYVAQESPSDLIEKWFYLVKRIRIILTVRGWEIQIDVDFSFKYISYFFSVSKQIYVYLLTPSFIIISFTSLLFFSLACFLACRDRSCFASSSSSPSFVDKSFSRCLTAFCLSEYCYYDIHRTIDDKWWELGSFVPMWYEISYAVRSIKIIIRVGEWQMSDRWWWWCWSSSSSWSCARRDDGYTDVHVLCHQ